MDSHSQKNIVDSIKVTMNRQQLPPVNDDNTDSSPTIPQDLVEDEDHVARLLHVRDARSSSSSDESSLMNRLKSMKLSDHSSSAGSSQKKMPASEKRYHDYDKPGGRQHSASSFDDSLIRHQWAEDYPEPERVSSRVEDHRQVQRPRRQIENTTYQEPLAYDEPRWSERTIGSYRHRRSNNEHSYERWGVREFQQHERPRRQQQQEQQHRPRRSWDGSHYDNLDEGSSYIQGQDRPQGLHQQRARRSWDGSDFHFDESSSSTFMEDDIYNDYEDSSRNRPLQRSDRQDQYQQNDMSSYYPIQQVRRMGSSPRPGGKTSYTPIKSRSSAAKISVDKWFDKDDDGLRYNVEHNPPAVRRKSRSVSSARPSHVRRHEDEFSSPIPRRDEPSNVRVSNRFHDDRQATVNDKVKSKQGVSKPVTPTPATSTTDSVTVEIAPGISSPLRGAAESMMAIKNGNTTEVECLCCCRKLHCIADAAYVICPDCRVVNQVPFGDWGVGLGF